MQLRNEIMQETQQHMGPQMGNAQTVANDFLADARTQYINWGCNATCITACTASIQAYSSCQHCACSKSAVTITVNPQMMH